MSRQQPSVNKPATTSRAVQLESFGGPEILNLREVPAPQAGSVVPLAAVQHAQQATAPDG